MIEHYLKENLRLIQNADVKLLDSIKNDTGEIEGDQTQYSLSSNESINSLLDVFHKALQ
jgi:hypothetical protein